MRTGPSSRVRACMRAVMLCALLSFVPVAVFVSINNDLCKKSKIYEHILKDAYH